MEITSFDMQLLTTIREMPGRGVGALSCPACGEELVVHQPEHAFPGRLLGTCPCEECAIWLALVLTPDRSRVHMIRIPSPAEFQEALSRHRSGNQAPWDIDPSRRS